MIRMTALDLLFILLWLATVVYGIVSGVIRQAFLIGSLLGGIFITGAIIEPASELTGGVTGLGASATLPFTYAFFVALVATLLFITSERAYPSARLPWAEALDRVAGGVLGFGAGLLGVAILTGVLLTITEVHWPILDGMRVYLRLQLQITPFLPLLADLFGFVTSAVKNLLPISIEEACARCL